MEVKNKNKLNKIIKVKKLLESTDKNIHNHIIKNTNLIKKLR